MTDLDFFFDPVCPFAWITSRWVVEVQQQRGYQVSWRFIALAVVNEHRVDADERYSPAYRAVHVAGMQSLRVADALRLASGNDAVAAFYTAIGTAFHPDRRRDQFLADPHGFLAELLTAIGQDPALASHLDDESHDQYLRDETALALGRTGKDLGTPLLTFHPGTAAEASFFGPVISRVPRGAEAVRLWDAVEVLASTRGMAELKRSLRDPIDYT
jgi:2-hydroxychromene-2-carboxylate isomerase